MPYPRTEAQERHGLVVAFHAGVFQAVRRAAAAFWGPASGRALELATLADEIAAVEEVLEARQVPSSFEAR